MNNKGVSLVVLSITIIILLILSTVSINLSFNGINNILDKNYSVELGQVNQAVFQQYNKAVTTKNINKSIDENKVEYFVGERLDNISEFELPSKDEIDNCNEVQDLYDTLEQYPQQCAYQEDYYYLVSPDELKKIGIYDSKDYYIVNYKNCESYNVSRKMNHRDELLYSKYSKTEENIDNAENTDNSNCNDWVE